MLQRLVVNCLVVQTVVAAMIVKQESAVILVAATDVVTQIIVAEIQPFLNLQLTRIYCGIEINALYDYF